MGIATEMKKLSEGIIASYDMRVRAVGELVRDTRTTLNGFAGDRKKMSAQQAKDLADFTNGLSKNVHGLLKKAHNLLNEFHKDNRQMGKEVAKSLSDFVSELTGDVRSMLSSFEKEHAQMSKELKNSLAKEIEDIQTQVESILGEADKLMGEYNSDMAQAKKAWSGMAAAIAKARRSGFAMPTVEAGKKATVKRAASPSQGKRKTARKSKGGRQKVHAGV
jgi:ribulose bisphosphate carboxylase small subunit